jgi:hypothetical protein
VRRANRVLDSWLISRCSVIVGVDVGFRSLISGNHIDNLVDCRLMFS